MELQTDRSSISNTPTCFRAFACRLPGPWCTVRAVDVEPRLKALSTAGLEHRRAGPGHPAQPRAGGLGLGLLGTERPGAQAAANEGLAAGHTHPLSPASGRAGRAGRARCRRLRPAPWLSVAERGEAAALPIATAEPPGPERIAEAAEAAHGTRRGLPACRRPPPARNRPAQPPSRVDGFPRPWFPEAIPPAPGMAIGLAHQNDTALYGLLYS